VRDPASRILRAEQTVKAIGHFLPKAIEFLGDDSECEPAAQVHQSGDGCAWSFPRSHVNEKMPYLDLDLGGRREGPEDR
jgi:hypothetical protein